MFYIFFDMYLTTFPVTPIGRPPGLLFSGFNRLAVKASKLLPVSEFEGGMFVLHKRFTKFAVDIRRSK